MKIYTKTGDAGDTGLFGGGRVPKYHSRVEAYGDVDELNAFLGLARVADPLPRIDDVLAPIQVDLFAIGALLATPNPEKMREQLAKARVDDERIGLRDARVVEERSLARIAGLRVDLLHISSLRVNYRGG